MQPTPLVLALRKTLSERERWRRGKGQRGAKKEERMKEDSDEAKTESIITRSELFFFFFSLFLWNGAYINMLRYPFEISFFSLWNNEYICIRLERKFSRFKSVLNCIDFCNIILNVHFSPRENVMLILLLN